VFPVLLTPSLSTIAALLGSEAGATIAWAHFLAFDLFVGRWIYLDSRERGLSAWLVSPLLVLTLLVGPLGLLGYLVARASTGRIAPLVLLRRAWGVNRPLTIVGVGMLGVLAASLAGLVLDGRVITGQPAWLKPAKFALSIAIYSFTLVWLLSHIRERRRLASLAAWLTAVAFVIEMAIIGLQAARGTTSHFNIATPLDSALWFTMGSFITVVWLMGVVVAALLTLQRFADPLFAWSLRLGVACGLVGMALAAPMTLPTAEQQASFARGHVVAAGAHAVGVADGGPGLPIVGWSTEGGDFRVSHFVGLHGMQVLPAVGWLLSLPALAWLSTRRRVALLWTPRLGYLGLTLLLFWQAQRGQPLIAPDALTFGVAAALAVAVAASSAALLFRGNGRSAPLLESSPR
jgi:hypothetical protein